jgi:hypothetical protein
MGDGSHLGVTAERALETILGGAPNPTEEERASRAQVQRRIQNTYMNWNGDEWPGYGDAADIIAGAVLDYFLDHPEAQSWPTDRAYEGEGSDRHPVGPDLYNSVKEWVTAPVRKVISECSGFQWGWAVNTARFCCELPEQANPAIMTISAPVETVTNHPAGGSDE